jgi:hypothetical protein
MGTITIHINVWVELCKKISQRTKLQLESCASCNKTTKTITTVYVGTLATLMNVRVVL